MQIQYKVLNKVQLFDKALKMILRQSLLFKKNALMNRILTGVLKESLGKAPPFLVQRSMNSQRGKKYSVLPAFHSS